MKKGIVLEGGGMRGLFTAGVLDVLMENDIYTDAAVTVSAGACFGCNYKSKQIGRVLRYNLKYINDKRYCSIYSLITTGDLFGAKFCYDEIPKKLDIFDEKAFHESPMEFYVVTSDVENGTPYYKKIDTREENYYEWIRASASLPLVSNIVNINGKKFLDGGITDSIPLKFAEKIGCEKNLVVLTQPYNYVKGKNKLIPLLRAVLGKYPRIVEASKNRHTMYNETTAYIKMREKQKSALIICPKEPLCVSRVEKNPEKLKLCYEEGRKCALEKLNEIKEFLK